MSFSPRVKKSEISTQPVISLPKSSTVSPFGVFISVALYLSFAVTRGLILDIIFAFGFSVNFVLFASKIISAYTLPFSLKISLRAS